METKWYRAEFRHIDWLWVGALVVMTLLSTATHAQVAVATSGAEAEAGALAVAGNKNVQQTVLPVNPSHTTADIKNVPSLGGMAGWAYAAPSGPCLGPSETKQGGVQAVWMGAGGGVNAGYGQSNLDWGCVVLREMAAADVMCNKGIPAACVDRNKLYELLPGISAVRAGTMPEYAKLQTVPAPAPVAAPRAAAPRAAAPAGTQQVSAVRQPTNCVADEYVARRTGAALCR